MLKLKPPKKIIDTQGLKKNTEPTLDMSNVYKVNHVNNSKIDKIYIFNGIYTNKKDKSELNQYFTNEELNIINNEKTQIIFSEQMIHYDDSIGTIKIKILNELKNQVSIEEIYLFCQKSESLNAVSVYQSLTQNNKLELTKIRLDQFMSNIISDLSGNKITMPVEKDVYTLDDILEMKLDDKKFILNKVLGQKFFIVENEYPFVCDPYKVEKYDSFFEKVSRKSLTTLNSHLLLTSGKIINNTIYLCISEEVLNHSLKNDISQETTIKIYFPFLYNKNINNLEDLHDSRSALIENNKKILNDKTIDLFKTVDLFYYMHNLKKTNLNYHNKGVKYIKVIIKPEFDIKIPLEIIFKIIHATENNPLIKYNPSSRQENIYRLYTDKIATDGRKIPFLKKSNIFKLMKTIARTKSVSVYIETVENDGSQIIICEFDENGYITISSEFNSAISETKIDELFRNAINPIITEIKILLEQSGYNLKKFNSLLDENVEVKQLTYESKIEITKPINLEDYKGCLSSIFNNETNQYKNTNNIILRFKRVANFNKVTSQEAFILEKSEQGYRGDEIIEALLENFRDDLTRDEAVNLVRKIANEIQLERGVRKSEIKIKDNPGFKTIISLEIKTGIITITVENINDINYLYTLPIYLDSVIRLTQDKTSTDYPIKKISEFCSSGSKEEFVVPDIISLSESSVSENETPSMELGDETVEYTDNKSFKADKPKGAFSLFYDDESDDEEIYKGGKNEDSESSISSAESEKSISSASSNTVSSPVSKLKSSSSESIPSEKSISENELSSIPSIASIETKISESIPSIPSIPSIETKISESIPSIPSIETKISESIPSIPSIETKIRESIPSIPSISEATASIKNKIDESIPSIAQTIKNKIDESIPFISQATASIKNKIDESIPSIEKKIDESIPSIEKKINESIPELSPIEKEKTSIHLALEEEPEEEPEEESKESEEDAEESDDEVNNKVINIDGMKLNKPYYFQTLIEKKDPILILKEDTKEFNAYSRTCSSDTRRQPVILTDTQLAKINKEHNGFLRDEDVIKYGSDPNNKFNYICLFFYKIRLSQN